MFYRVERIREDLNNSNILETIYFNHKSNVKNFAKENGFTYLLGFGRTESTYCIQHERMIQGAINAPEYWIKTTQDSRFFLKVYPLKTEEEFES